MSSKSAKLDRCIETILQYILIFEFIVSRFHRSVNNLSKKKINMYEA